jgi:GxxExxY protein
VAENEVGERLLGCALTVHRRLGPGLLESAYEACLCHELAKAGLAFERQLAMPIRYDDVLINPGYRLDLLVEGIVVAEVKAIDALTDVHRAQLLSYLTLGGFRLGYLLNFNAKMLRDGIVRLVKGL